MDFLIIEKRSLESLHNLTPKRVRQILHEMLYSLDSSPPKNHPLFSLIKREELSARRRMYKEQLQTLLSGDLLSNHHELLSHIFEFKVNKIFPELWFLEPRFEINRKLLKGLQTVDPNFIKMIEDFDGLEYLDEISDQNVSYHLIPHKKKPRNFNFHQSKYSEVQVFGELLHILDSNDDYFLAIQEIQ